ncbi:DUF6551 family protein [Rhizobium sp. ARZ01]|uniref:DUF6551 family protein n=1 Tax=Rhizobium sp. ARZ01 TaxID=2769313 RepID=UPI001FEF5291|nr:DUF6551 family protein [Rhizobium sp. ARZ01]
MRSIDALSLPDIAPAPVPDWMPEIRHVDPRTLVVDESYQRALSERSVRLIRKIVSQWDWSAFKPPVVVDVGGALEVIDGQHTAIGAVTHGGIAQIPVLVVRAVERKNRAGAFVRHNRDRIQVTPTQLHTALVEAGDEDAMTIAQVCQRAGVTILKNPPPMARFRPGETIAVSTIGALVNRRHAAGARKVLEICVQGGACPISADLIKAVEHLLHAAEYKGELQADRIALLISSRLSTLEAEAKRFAAERKLPLWRALASVLFMNRRKARHD